MHNNPISFGRLKQKTSFYIIRHGESEGNRRKMIQGHVDMPLTDTGREHAAAAASYFANGKLDCIISSPLSRALETAQIIGKQNDIDETSVQQLDDLMELNTGIFSGMAVSDIQENYPEHWDRFKHFGWNSVPGAESIQELLNRASLVWEKLIDLANMGNRNVLAVSHGGTIQWLFKRTFSDRWSNAIPQVHTGNCGIYQLNVTPVPVEPGSEGPGFYSEWVRINHLPYNK